MPRRFALPCVYAAAALATAVSTLAPLASTPASGVAAAPPEPTRPYIVTARNRADARDLLAESRLRIRRYYTAALPGFATYLSEDQAARLRADRRVRSLEPDLRVRLARHGRHQARRTAGRHERAVPARRATGQRAGGQRVTVYLLDSGIDDLGDRTWRAYDATGGRGQDCSGHGTRAARKVARRTRHARIASVRVLDCADTGRLSDVIAGIDWVRGHARGPAVTNVSVGAASAALDTALRRLARAGVTVVDAPRAAGAAARYLESHPDTSPFTLASWLKSTAAHGAIRQNPTRTLPGGGH